MSSLLRKFRDFPIKLDSPMKFSIEKRENCQIIHCNTTLTRQTLEELLELVKSALESFQEISGIVLDFEKKVDMDGLAARTFKDLAMSLRAGRIQLYLMNFTDSTLSTGKSEDIFPTVGLLKDPTMLWHDGTPLEQHRDLFDAIQKGVLSACKQMDPKADIQVQDPFIPGPLANISFDVVSTQPLQTEAKSGTLFLSFPKKTFLKIMTDVHGHAVSKLDASILDGAVELMNILRSQARSHLTRHFFDGGIPHLEESKKAMGLFAEYDFRAAIPFTCDGEPFHALVAMDLGKYK